MLIRSEGMITNRLPLFPTSRTISTITLLQRLTTHSLTLLGPPPHLHIPETSTTHVHMTHPSWTTYSTLQLHVGLNLPQTRKPPSVKGAPLSNHEKHGKPTSPLCPRALVDSRLQTTAVSPTKATSGTYRVRYLTSLTTSSPPSHPLVFLKELLKSSRHLRTIQTKKKG